MPYLTAEMKEEAKALLMADREDKTIIIPGQRPIERRFMTESEMSKISRTFKTKKTRKTYPGMNLRRRSTSPV